MAYTRFLNGFEVTTSSAIDKRILLTKAQMLATSNDQLYNVPDIYLALCLDDSKLYLYDKRSDWDEETGRYHPVDNSITFDTPEAQANIENIIASSESVSDLEAVVNGDGQQEGLVAKVANLEDTVAGLEVDGGVIE